MAEERTVGQIQDDIYSEVEGALELGTDFIQELKELAQTDSITTSSALPEVEFFQDRLGTLGFLTTYLGERPTIDGVALTLPDAPNPAFSTADAITVPDFTTAAPSLNIPETPSTALPSVPSAPSISDVSMPDAPVVTLPTAPTFATVTLPLPPSVDIPSFTAGLPSEDFFTPTNNFTFYEEQYTSDLLDELNSKLLADLQNGGYGIETADEQALFDRARDREIETYLMEVDELRRGAASRGFPLPPGALYIEEQKARQMLQAKISSVNRDIAIKRSDLYVENRRFAMEQSKNIEQILIGFHNSVQERSLNFAKATLDAAIAIYEAQLKRYNARLDAYKIEAQVFEARIRAALSQVEIYRTQMEGSRLELESQKAQADLYRTQLQGIETVVNIFKTRVEAVNVQAAVERTRIDAFRSLIDAYQAQVQAKVAQFGMYEAQIKGELSKVQVFEAQAKAYSATVEGAKVRSDISLGNLRQETEQARAQIDVYQGRLKGSELDLQRQVETIRAQTNLYQTDTQAFDASARALAEYLRLEQLQGNANKEMVIRAAGVQIENVRTELSLLQALFDVKLKAAGTAGDYIKSLVTGLTSQLNAIATVAE